MAAKAGRNGSDSRPSAGADATRHQHLRRKDMNKETKPLEADCDDLLGNPAELISQEIPPGIDRRKFLMRSAVGGAAAIMTGSIVSAHERIEKAVATLPLLPQQPTPAPPLDP